MLALPFLSASRQRPPHTEQAIADRMQGLKLVDPMDGF